MDEIIVAYWSGGGNTEAMAKAVAKGIEDAGKKAKVCFVDDISASDLKDASCFALGCPAMGDEVIEETSMEPFVAEVEGFCAGRTVALFGSYDWGDGQWMRDWTQRMQDAGAFIVNDEGLIANNEPQDEDLANCEALGKALASR